MAHKFIIMSQYGELLPLGMRLKREGSEVYWHVTERDFKAIGEGLLESVENWWECIGEDYVWVFDSCGKGNLQDWLRKKGELVVGGTEATDELENDRQMGQKLFKEAGFLQPVSKNYKDFASAIKDVKASDKTWILKQNGGAPKHLNHKGKFKDGADMLFHLEALSKSWNEAEYGPVDFDLMEVVEGLEVAASAFFNGEDWLRDSEGKVVGYLNFEDKKEFPGNLGETTDEMGTTFIGTDEDNELFSNILLRPEVVRVLKETKFKGVFDINCIKTENGLVALEPTCRFGVPATAYEFVEAIKSSTSELLHALAAGEKTVVDLHKGIGIVVVVVAKPSPIENTNPLAPESTSLNERIWILKDGKPQEKMDAEQEKHIQLYNVRQNDDGYLVVATKFGCILNVTATGENLDDVREDVLKYIKENLYIPGMKYRNDIGMRVQAAMGITPRDRMVEMYENKLKERDTELAEIKAALEETLYGDDD